MLNFPWESWHSKQAIIALTILEDFGFMVMDGDSLLL